MGGVDASSDPAYELLQLFQMLSAVSRVSFDEPAALTPEARSFGVLSNRDLEFLGNLGRRIRARDLLVTGNPCERMHAEPFRPRQRGTMKLPRCCGSSPHSGPWSMPQHFIALRWSQRGLSTMSLRRLRECLWYG